MFDDLCPYTHHCRKMFNQLNHRDFDYSGYFVIALTDNESVHPEMIQKIMQDFWAIQISNVNVLVPSDDAVVVYTYFQYTKSQCNGFTAVEINRFENGQFQRSDIFPEKFENLHRCSLIAFMPHFIPYITYDEPKNLERMPRGLEVNIGIELAKRLNFTLLLDSKLRKTLQLDTPKYNATKVIRIDKQTLRLCNISCHSRYFHI